ncbi:protein S100-G-like [Labrus mixtus]|uniref:protein S100-G-like n=1 Tax=Labrus mixtus TaxID=508554 RepID=UPI0029C0D557|nr:protein S100-G-like [Labrus mixtus]
MSAPKPNITKLRAVISLLIGAYDDYASAEGCKKTLNKNEFKTLIQTEMPELLENSRSQKQMKEMYDMFDHDRDGAVDFQEFATTVTALACCLREMPQ